MLEALRFAGSMYYVLYRETLRIGCWLPAGVNNLLNYSRPTVTDRMVTSAWVAELADAPDLKSGAPQGAYGFDPRPGHLAVYWAGFTLTGDSTTSIFNSKR